MLSSLRLDLNIRISCQDVCDYLEQDITWSLGDFVRLAIDRQNENATANNG